MHACDAASGQGLETRPRAQKMLGEGHEVGVRQDWQADGWWWKTGGKRLHDGTIKPEEWFWVQDGDHQGRWAWHDAGGYYEGFVWEDGEEQWLLAERKVSPWGVWWWRIENDVAVPKCRAREQWHWACNREFYF